MLSLGKSLFFTLAAVVTLNHNVSGVSITISTCNMWNIMFNWKIRAEYIAEIVRDYDIDVIAFQELRQTILNSDKTPISQLDEFSKHLPEFKWALTRAAGSVTRPDDSYWIEWNNEGLGILSRKQVIFSSTVNLTKSGHTDANPRIAVHVQLRLDQLNVVDVIVVHFSYDRSQQCKNAVELLDYINKLKVSKVIILGDFNVYPDFHGPIEVFTQKRQSACLNENDIPRQLLGSFKDAWTLFNRQMDGFTFSNMPEPGLISRPDRILLSGNISVEEMSMVGDGNSYEINFYSTILLSRFEAILQTSMHSLMGKSGYSCLHDCGPHGSCRCGVCIKGGNTLNCNIPNCHECNGKTFLLIAFIIFLVIVTALTFFFAIVKMLVVSSHFNQQDLWDILGYRCCLFNKKLFVSFNLMPRKYRSKLLHLFFICQLPPILLMLLMSVFLIFLLFLSQIIFTDGIKLIYSILPEELFPSDHLMVFTKLKL